MENKLNDICKQFCLEGTILSVKPLGEGFINDTLLITTSEASAPNYILQRKNKNIFQDIPAMMDNIYRVTTHLKEKIIAAGGDPMREAMTIIPTHDGKFYYQDEDGEFWAVCVFIDNTIAYQKADTPELAYQGGKGIGKFQSMLSDFKEPLADILPGFHNIRYRFKQWDETLAKDPVGRKAAVAEEIQWIENRREEMLHFWELVENGTIPTRITHNDTKINNILFDQKGNVLCVIDLDTVLSSTCLNDYGDAMRSYTNTGLEDDENLDNVSMDMDIFRGYTQGYLSETAGFLNRSEIDYLAFSAKYITYEQVLRFLMDYIDGDNYYKVKNKEHNLIRARAQYKLLQSMEAQYAQMCDIVKEEIKKENKFHVHHSLSPHLSSSCIQEEDKLFDVIPAQAVACNNWAKEYPYAPQVSFRIAHNNEAIFIHFDVRENYTMAKVSEDNGEVWTDSCVEFFLAVDDSGYYNFEFSCIGKALAGFRKERHNATHGTPEIMHSIKRHASLGNTTFEERIGDNHWSLLVTIPATALFKHNIRQLGGLKAKANVYKCGDNLSKPHFLSWQPIDTPTPNFHVPAFFTEIEFQK